MRPGENQHLAGTLSTEGRPCPGLPGGRPPSHVNVGTQCRQTHGHIHPRAGTHAHASARAPAECSVRADMHAGVSVHTRVLVCAHRQTEVAALTAGSLHRHPAVLPGLLAPHRQPLPAGESAGCPVPGRPSQGTVWSARQAPPCVSDVRSPRAHSAIDPRPWGHSWANTGLMPLSAPLGWPADTPKSLGLTPFISWVALGQSYRQSQWWAWRVPGKPRPGGCCVPSG